MFPDYVSMTTLGSDVKFLTDEKAEAGRVKHGPAAEDTVLWETAQLPCHIGENINWEQKAQTSISQYG